MMDLNLTGPVNLDLAGLAIECNGGLIRIRSEADSPFARHSSLRANVGANVEAFLTVNVPNRHGEFFIPLAGPDNAVPAPWGHLLYHQLSGRERYGPHPYLPVGRLFSAVYPFLFWNTDHRILGHPIPALTERMAGRLLSSPPERGYRLRFSFLPFVASDSRIRFWREVAPELDFGTVVTFERALLSDPTVAGPYGDWCEERGWAERAEELQAAVLRP